MHVGALPSKDILRRKLDKPGCLSTFDLSEGGVLDLTIHRCRSIELRVIEDIERLKAQGQRARICEMDVLLERHVEVLDARPVEHPPLRVASCPSVSSENSAVLNAGLPLRPLVLMCRDPG